MGAASYDWSAFQTIKDANFTPTGRTPIFHYVISAHNYDSTTSSGISRGIGASDLIVSLGSFTNGVGTVNEQAGTLMHELGHNLGLQHGGGDSVNYKPNYLSVMSYAFQINGLIKNGVGGTFDYSRSALANLNELSLSEPLGIGAAGYGTRHYCAGVGYVAVNDASGPIDWNCNGTTTETGVSYDVNNDSANSTLTGYNDWANLKLKVGAIGLAGVQPDLPATTPVDPLTTDEAKKVVQYQFSGFFQPVDNPPTVNTVQAGRALPVKFSLNGDRGLTIFAPGSPSSQDVACSNGAPIDAIEETVTAGASALSYDSVTDTYSYVWKTSKTWAGTCRQLTLTFNDGSHQDALMRFTK